MAFPRSVLKSFLHLVRLGVLCTLAASCGSAAIDSAHDGTGAQQLELYAAGGGSGSSATTDAGTVAAWTPDLEQHCSNQSGAALASVGGIWKSICNIFKRQKPPSYNDLSPKSKQVAQCADKILASGLLKVATAAEIVELLPPLKDLPNTPNKDRLIALFFCIYMADMAEAGVSSVVDNFCIRLHNLCLRIPNKDAMLACVTSVEGTCAAWEIKKAIK
jgi:hypothetical protein